MRLDKITLTNFRSCKKKEYAFNQQVTLLVGPNASGKTNVLEAIYLLATGESIRARKIEEMVKWNEPVAHVVGQIQNQPEGREDLTNRMELRVTLTRGEVEGKRVNKRRLLVNGLGKRRLDFAGNLSVVLFRPEDMRLVEGSPSRRREFLDGVLFQVDRDYRRSLVNYEKALRRRNRVLDLIREGETRRTALVFWDKLLIEEGNVLTNKRRELIDQVNAHAYEKVGEEKEIYYDHSIISEKRLEKYWREEVAAGHTLVGPHKDDFKIIGKGDRDLAIYGSRGEQRMAVLWLKIQELGFIREKKKEAPILLLDDVFSELDDENDRVIMSLINQQQTIITMTEENGKLKSVRDVGRIEIN